MWRQARAPCRAAWRSSSAWGTSSCWIRPWKPMLRVRRLQTKQVCLAAFSSGCTGNDLSARSTP